MAISIDPNYIRVRAGIPDPVAMQMDFLQKLLSSPNAPQESIQHFYYTTILFCIDDNKEESAFKLLSQAKQGGIFNEQPGLRASLYSSAISKLVEKGFHDKAHELYKETLELALWKGSVFQKETAQRALEGVGFKFGHEIQANHP